MNETYQLILALDDDELLGRTRECARTEREASALLVAHLAEIEGRELAFKRGYSSLFQYARQELRLSEAMAWERISAAKLAVQMPEAIEKLACGELTLAAAGELWKTLRESEKQAPAKPTLPALQPSLDLSPSKSPELEGLPLRERSRVPSPSRSVCPPSLEEKRGLLSQILGKTRRESVAVLQDWRRERAGEPKATAPAERTSLDVSLTDEQLAQWDRLRDLVSHKLGTTDPQKVFEWLLNLGLEKVDPVRKEARIQKRKKAPQEQVQQQPEAPPAAPFLADLETPQQSAVVERAPPRARKVLPAALKRKVFIRDQGRCQFIDAKSGRPCEATAFLDYDHRLPLSEGGGDTEENLMLSCASHNRRRLSWELPPRGNLS